MICVNSLELYIDGTRLPDVPTNAPNNNAQMLTVTVSETASLIGVRCTRSSAGSPAIAAYTSSGGLVTDTSWLVSATGFINAEWATPCYNDSSWSYASKTALVDPYWPTLSHGENYITSSGTNTVLFFRKLIRK